MTFCKMRNLLTFCQKKLFSLIQGATVLGGNVAMGNLGNIIRLAPAQTVAGQDKNSNNSATAATHFIGVNQQGQQVLIQRAATPNPQQNLVVRALPQQNVVQIQQSAGSAGNVSSASPYPQSVLQVGVTMVRLWCERYRSRTWYRYNSRQEMCRLLLRTHRGCYR